MKKRIQPLGFEHLEVRHFLAASPIITEFMASNNGTILDGYGAANDWIELYNAGDESVDLLNFSLTDNSDNLGKWKFPSVSLAPGQYMVVFASSRNELDPAGHLHTNFGLSASGEYLALVNPMGEVLSEYGTSQTDFPLQSSDASFGVAFDSVAHDAVTAQSATKYLVPTDGAVDATWMLPQFDDAAWASGTARLGYEVSPGAYASLIQTQLPVGAQSVFVRIPFTVNDVDTVVGALRMRYDDGFVAYLNGVEVARKSAPNTLTYDAVATEFHPQEAAVIDEAFNISAYSSLLQVGENVLAIHLLDSAAGPIPDLLLAPSLKLSTGTLRTPSMIGGMITPTPGVPNTNIIASDVEFSRVGGAIASPIMLHLSNSGVGEVIRYTTDGSNPDESSPLYAGPISISATVEVRARAFGMDGQIGKVRTEAFTVVATEFADFTSDLPIIVLENFGGGIPDREFEDAMFALYETDGTSGRSSLADQPNVTSQIAQHRRGSSTYNQPKPNLRIEFRDELGQDKDVSLLGMPSESDWILYAPHDTDLSMLRNVVMYDLSGQVVDYAVRTRFVEVFANHDGGVLDHDDYLGVYVLMENIKRDDGRIAIDPLTPADVNAPEITGGYIVKVDRADAEEDSSWDVTGTPSTTPHLVHVDPKRSEMTQEQVDYIRGYITEFEAALYGANWKDPNVGYAAYIDVNSWIDHHILRAFSREKDVLVLSEHLFKPRGGKLTFGPAWDFDRSSGSEGTFIADAEGWAVNNSPLRIFQYGWWGRLFGDPNFKQKWIDRWQELRDTTYSDANLNAVVASHAAEIEESQARNTTRWPTVAPNGGAYATPGLEGWEAETSHLANWLTARAAWIDEQVVSRPSIELELTAVPGETEVTLVHAAGVLYYTLDGSDPRAIGGGISPTALVYAGPFTIAAGIEVNARVYHPSGFSTPFTAWSGMESETSELNDLNPLRIVEIMYNPPGSADDTEYFELLNTGSQAIQLADVQITEFSSGGFTFSPGILNPGERIVVVKDHAAFAVAYPGVTNVAAGVFSGSLSNEGELIALRSPLGELLQSFTYGDSNIAGWPETPDGDGYSLEYIGFLNVGENPLDVSPADPFDNPINWRPSLQVGGSPGTSGELSEPDSGDFNGDDVVDGADFLAWQRGFGAANAERSNGDANNDQIVDADDLAVWTTQFGSAPPALAPFTSSMLTPMAMFLPATDQVTVENTPKSAGMFWIEALALPSPFVQLQSAPAPATIGAPDVQLADEAFAQYGSVGSGRRRDFGDLEIDWPAEEESSEGEIESVDLDARLLRSLAMPS